MSMAPALSPEAGSCPVNGAKSRDEVDDEKNESPIAGGVSRSMKPSPGRAPGVALLFSRGAHSTASEKDRLDNIGWINDEFEAMS